MSKEYHEDVSPSCFEAARSFFVFFLVCFVCFVVRLFSARLSGFVREQLRREDHESHETREKEREQQEACDDYRPIPDWNNLCKSTVVTNE